MPTWGEGRPGRAIAGLWREEDGGIGAEDLAGPEVRVQEFAACQIQAIVGGTGAVGGGVKQHRIGGGILKRKERIGKVIESVRDTSGASARDKDNIVRERGRDVKSPDTVVSPRLYLGTIMYSQSALGAHKKKCNSNATQMCFQCTFRVLFKVH